MLTPWIFGSLGSKQPRPRHLEAYPRLDVGAALRNLRRERTMIAWRGPLQMFGCGFVDLPSPVHLHLKASMVLDQFGAYRHCDLSFDVTYKGSSQDNNRAYIKCPDCESVNGIFMFCESKWRCRSCHRLENRSALIGTEVRWSERLRALENELAEGRPPGMRHSFYEAKVQERAGLERRLGGRRPSANSSFNALVVAEWMAPSVELQDRIRWRGRPVSQ